LQLNPEIEDETHHSGAQVLAKRRINIAKFLQWCREAGVRDITLFETEDLGWYCDICCSTESMGVGRGQGGKPTPGF